MKSKALKRAEAEARQREYDALPLDKRYDRAVARRGDSKRERARIIAESFRRYDEEHGM